MTHEAAAFLLMQEKGDQALLAAAFSAAIVCA